MAPYFWNKFIVSYYESIEETAIDEAQTVHKNISDFCKEHGVSGNKANLAAVCAEEILRIRIKK